MSKVVWVPRRTELCERAITAARFGYQHQSPEDSHFVYERDKPVAHQSADTLEVCANDSRKAVAAMLRGSVENENEAYQRALAAVIAGLQTMVAIREFQLDKEVRS